MSYNMRGGQLHIEYLELVDTSQTVTLVIALLALVVSVATYRLNVRDKRYVWEVQERTQAEEVAGWLVREMCDEHNQMEWKAYVRNSSKSPVYDVLYVVHDTQDLDAAMPEMIPLIPPETTWNFFPTWFGNQPEGNPQVYMTFRDKRGKAWQRDTHGRLTLFRRNVDNAPPADPVSGRIEPRLGTFDNRSRAGPVMVRRSRSARLRQASSGDRYPLAMTPQHDEPGIEAAPSEPQLVREVNTEPDVILRALVAMVNQLEGTEIGLTLHLNGVIVSGLLTSYNSYMRAVAKMIRDNGSPESQPGRESLALVFDSFIDPSTGAEAQSDSDGESVNMPDHIHMRAATVHAPGADYYLPETLWRGRLSHVSAWSMGNFGPKPPPGES